MGGIAGSRMLLGGALSLGNHQMTLTLCVSTMIGLVSRFQDLECRGCKAQVTHQR